MKKDFSGISTDRVYNTIAEATAAPESEPVQEQPAAAAIPPALDDSEVKRILPQRKTRKTYNEQEKSEILRSLKTSGRKGCKLPRINLAFAPDVYEYICTMSQVRGESMTSFIDHILRQSMKENEETYAKAIEFKNSL